MVIYVELILAPAELVLMKPSVKIYLSKHVLFDPTIQLSTYSE